MRDRTHRLSVYRQTLSRLRAAGMASITSGQIAESCGTTAAVVRKDLAAVRIPGRRRGGYALDDLVRGLERILAADAACPVVLFGCGNLGSALLRYRGFTDGHHPVVAAFESDPRLLADKGAPPVLPADRAAPAIRRLGAAVAIIAVPAAAAQAVLETAVRGGVRGVLNFAPVHLRAPEGICVRNVNLEIELENVIQGVRQAARETLPEVPPCPKKPESRS